jgi:hypothetical protein
VYSEDRPHPRFMTKIKSWLKLNGLNARALLVSKSNLVIAVLDHTQGSRLICFYIQKLCSIGTGGMIVYHDLDAMTTRLKNNVKNTFTNWLAHNAIT